MTRREFELVSEAIRLAWARNEKALLIIIDAMEVELDRTRPSTKITNPVSDPPPSH